jgi:hypothetical protein
MRTDLYTKTVLTVIALALLWIAAGGPSLVPAAHAEAGVQQKPADAAKAEPQKVYIAGLVSADGKLVGLTQAGMPVFTVPNAQFVAYVGGWVGNIAGRPGVASFPAQPLPVTSYPPPSR